MILYPAIDLKDGQAVRLVHGDMDRATVFNDDPAAQARAFVAAGCQWLHLVDLNGAFAGAPVNAAPVEAILAFAPGGQGEMAVLALVAGADVAFVVTHHLVRLVIVIAGAPLMRHWLGWDRDPAD